MLSHLKGKGKSHHEGEKEEDPSSLECSERRGGKKEEKGCYRVRKKGKSGRGG